MGELPANALWQPQVDFCGLWIERNHPALVGLGDFRREPQFAGITVVLHAPQLDRHNLALTHPSLASEKDHVSTPLVTVRAKMLDQLLYDFVGERTGVRLTLFKQARARTVLHEPKVLDCEPEAS